MTMKGAEPTFPLATRIYSRTSPFRQFDVAALEALASLSAHTNIQKIPNEMKRIKRYLYHCFKFLQHVFQFGEYPDWIYVPTYILTVDEAGSISGLTRKPGPISAIDSAWAEQFPGLKYITPPQISVLAFLEGLRQQIVAGEPFHCPILTPSRACRKSCFGVLILKGLAKSPLSGLSKKDERDRMCRVLS